MSATALLLREYHAASQGAGLAPIALCGSGFQGAPLRSFDSVANGYALQPDYRYGMRFPVNPFKVIYGACFRLKKQIGSPSGGAKLVVHSLDGAGANTDDPADYEGDSFEISGVTTASAGAFYWLPLRVDVRHITDLYVALQVESDASMDGSNYVIIRGVSANAYAGAQGLLTQLPSTTVGGTTDLAFRIYGQPRDAILKKVRDRRRARARLF